MPEGDTIFRAARTLNRALGGKVITRFEAGYAKLAHVDDEKTIEGRIVESVEARGKWLLMFLSGDLILLTHMLMNGSWHIYRSGEPWRRQRRDMRIVIETSDWIAVAFTVPVAEFHSAATLARMTRVTSLGPDLLKGDFDPDLALVRIRERAEEEIAVVLLNQRVLAGIGNVFKSEICFACGVHPFLRVNALTAAQLKRIIEVSSKFLKVNVLEDADGKVSASTGARRTTNSLEQSARLWVYGRRGEPCRRCGTEIVMRRQGAEARTTFWCPDCQPLSWAALDAGTVDATPLEGGSYRRRGTSRR